MPVACHIMQVCDGAGVCGLGGPPVTAEFVTNSEDVSGLRLAYDGVAAPEFGRIGSTRFMTFVGSIRSGDEEITHTVVVTNIWVWSVVTRTHDNQRVEMRFLDCDFPTGSLY